MGRYWMQDRGGVVLLVALAALTFVRLLIAARMPLTPDEAYYWCWAHHLQGAYLDHPGMVAFWIRGGTALLGDSPLGVRWLGPVSTLVGSLLIHDAAHVFAPRPGGGVRAVLLLNATLMIGVGALTMTPDTPLVFFCAVALWAAARLMAHGGWRWAAATGAALGLAFDSKYSAGLWILAFALWLLMEKRGWGERLRWLVAAGIAGTMTVLPVLAWNAEHGWVSFVKQGGRAGVWHPERAAQFLGELLGGQIALATPLIFLALVMGVVGLRRQWRTDASARLLWLCVIVPVAVFLLHALGDRVQANWPVLAYPAAALAAARGRQSLRWPVGTGAALNVIVYLQLLTPYFSLPPKLDVLGRQTAGWEGFATALQALATSQGGVVYADDYGVSAELAYSGRSMQVAGFEDRWLFSGLPHIAARSGLYVIRAGRRPPAPLASFVSKAPLATLCRFPGICFDVYRIDPAPIPWQATVYLPRRR